MGSRHLAVESASRAWRAIRIGLICTLLIPGAVGAQSPPGETSGRESRHGRTADYSIVDLAATEVEQKLGFVTMRDGQVVHIDYDALGRVSRVRIAGKKLVLVVNYEGDRADARSIDAYDGPFGRLVRTHHIRRGLAPGQGSQSKFIENDDWTKDPYLSDTMYNIEYILDPYGFSLDWDYLSWSLRTEEERTRCLMDCYNACSDAADMASLSCMVATAFAAEVLTPVGAGLYGATCYGTVLFNKSQCNSRCGARCT